MGKLNLIIRFDQGESCPHVSHSPSLSLSLESCIAHHSFNPAWRKCIQCLHDSFINTCASYFAKSVHKSNDTWKNKLNLFCPNFTPGQFSVYCCVVKSSLKSPSTCSHAALSTSLQENRPPLQQDKTAETILYAADRASQLVNGGREIDGGGRLITKCTRKKNNHISTATRGLIHGILQLGGER